MPPPSFCFEPLDEAQIQKNAPWTNWLGNIQYTVPQLYFPSTVRQLVFIITHAEILQVKVKAVGSGWSFEDCAVTSDWLVDLRNLNKRKTFLTHEGSELLVDKWKTLHFDLASTRTLFHVEAGIRLLELNKRLELENLAMLTLGGSQGQTLAGAISTSSHGSQPNQPPLHEAVRAIHLVSTSGRQFWIERSSDPVTNDDDKLLRELDCADVQIVRDDAMFRAALVGVGRLGIVYSYVLEVQPKYYLSEFIMEDEWSEIKEKLNQGVQSGGSDPKSLLTPLLASLPGPPAELSVERNKTDVEFIDVVMTSQGEGRFSSHKCWIRRRWRTDDSEPLRIEHPAIEYEEVTALQNLPTKEDGPDEAHAARAILAGAIGMLNVQLAIVTAKYGLIPFYGEYRMLEVSAQIIALTARLTQDLSIAEAARHALNSLWKAGVSETLISEIVHEVIKSRFESEPRRGTSWRVLVGNGTGGGNPGNSIEVVFDATNPQYLEFVDELLDAAKHRRVAGYIAVRFTRASDAYLSMHNVKSQLAVSIEVASLKGLDGNDEWMRFIDDLANGRIENAPYARDHDHNRVGHGSRLHWGQHNKLSLLDVLLSYGADHNAWCDQCLRIVGPHGDPFSNSYTYQRGLEPSFVIRDVTHVVRTDGRVTHLCNPGQWWSPIDVREAIAQSDAKICSYRTKVTGHPRASLRVRRFLTTAADDTTANNLDELSHWSWKSTRFPPIGDVEVKEVEQSKSRFTTIKRIGDSSADWNLPMDLAHDFVVSGRNRFYIAKEQGERTYLEPREFLSTNADHTRDNNLGELPECP